jgi:hypothetical protein
LPGWAATPNRYLRFSREYPGDWHLRPKVIIADDQHGVAWFEWRMDEGSADAVAFFEFAGRVLSSRSNWPERAGR